MTAIAVYLHAWRHLLYIAIDTDMQIALAAHALEEFAVVTFTALYERGQNQYLLASIIVQNHIDDLLLRVFHHRLASHVTVGLSGTCKEQAQVVVDFRRGAHGGTRILVGGLLLDADDR